MNLFKIDFNRIKMYLNVTSKDKILNIVYSIIIAIFFNLIIKPIWVFGIDISVQNQVGESNYGLFYAIFSILMIFNIILDFGISQIFSSEIAINKQGISKYFKGFIKLKIILFVFFIVITFFIFYFNNLVGNYTLIFILIFQQFFFFLILFFRAILSGNQNFKTDSFFSILDRLIMIIIYIIFNNLLNININILYFSLIMLAGEVITFLIIFLFIFFKFDFKNIKFLDIKINKVVKITYWLSISSLFMALAVRIDSFMIYKLIPDNGNSAGLYAGVFRIYDFLISSINIIVVIMIPLFSKFKSNLKQLRIYYVSIGILIFTCILILSCVIFFNSNIILETLYHKLNADQSKSLGILVFSLLGIWIQNIYLSLLIAFKQVKYFMYVSIIGAIFSLVLNYIYIPQYGFLGSSYINLAISTLMAILLIIIFEFYLVKNEKHLCES